MRTAELNRKTKETDISIKLSLDGGEVEIATGIGFFDHMLNSFAVHGGFGLKIKASGDLHVDAHHTVEDVGIVLGKAFAAAVNTSKVARFGSFVLPMDEALVSCALDISGRPYLVFNGELPQERCGEFDSCLCVEFFRAFAVNSGVTLHINIEYGDNAHHIIEAAFKAAAHSMRIATRERAEGVLSTKGVL
ncbi:MAG: imidazoleglycerol-phosphate dehydratase HisB [Oscillospiraceae bacterium]|jgi:imidazoleglycerol-phosphate dehydratase|nr:imidazoleglycerol-phosphate dehydratase HisB [Oscillospiraceae bacterium]